MTIRRRLIALCAAAACIAPAAGSEEQPKPKRRIDLGLYARPPGAPPPENLIGAPRFEASVEVQALAPPDLNETMALWWEHWQISTGSIYGRGINIQDQGCPTCVNILPLFDWAAQKWKDRKRNKQPEESPGPPEP